MEMPFHKRTQKLRAEIRIRPRWVITYMRTVCIKGRNCCLKVDLALSIHARSHTIKKRLSTIDGIVRRDITLI